MSCSNNCNNNSTSYITNIGNAARRNNKARTTLFLGDFLRVTLMCVERCGEVDTEVHEDQDQLITLACGTATVHTGNTRCSMNCSHRLCAGDSVFIPAGTWHRICNTGNGVLKLYSVYSVEQEDDDDDDCGCHSGTSVTARNTCGCAATNTFGYNLQARNDDDNDYGCNRDCGC